jgi:predicted XRE-type DNA-binding protein
LTQAEAARRLGITQPRLNDLLRSKIDKFSLDMLITLASNAGIAVRLEIAA